MFIWREDAPLRDSAEDHPTLQDAPAAPEAAFYIKWGPMSHHCPTWRALGVLHQPL